MYEWILFVILTTSPVHVGKVGDFKTIEECKASAVETVEWIVNNLRPSEYEGLKLVCLNKQKKVKI